MRSANQRVALAHNPPEELGPSSAAIGEPPVPVGSVRPDHVVAPDDPSVLAGLLGQFGAEGHENPSYRRRQLEAGADGDAPQYAGAAPQPQAEILAIRADGTAVVTPQDGANGADGAAGAAGVAGPETRQGAGDANEAIDAGGADGIGHVGGAGDAGGAAAAAARLLADTSVNDAREDDRPPTMAALVSYHLCK